MIAFTTRLSPFEQGKEHWPCITCVVISRSIGNRSSEKEKLWQVSRSNNAPRNSEIFYASGQKLAKRLKARTTGEANGSVP
jgi:hypothetical protein